MKVTIKRLVEILKFISSEHKQINSFGVGDIFKINTQERIQPTLWAEIRQSTDSRVVTSIGLRLYIMDLVEKGEENSLHVHSDTMLMIKDVLVTLKRKFELIDEEAEHILTPFTHKFNDAVSGWYVDINIDTESIYGDCDVPSEQSDPIFIDENGSISIVGGGKVWKITVNEEGKLVTELIEE